MGMEHLWSGRRMAHPTDRGPPQRQNLRIDQGLAAGTHGALPRIQQQETAP